MLWKVSPRFTHKTHPFVGQIGFSTTLYPHFMASTSPHPWKSLDVIFWLSGVQFSSVLLRTCQVGTFRGWPLRTQLSNQFGRDLLSFCCIRGGGGNPTQLCGDSKLTIVRIPINQPGFHSSRSRDLPPEIHEYSQINLGPIIFGDQTMRRYERFYGFPPMIVHCWGISPKVFWVVATQTFYIFIPKVGGNDAIWGSYFSDGWFNHELAMVGSWISIWGAKNSSYF